MELGGQIGENENVIKLKNTFKQNENYVKLNSFIDENENIQSSVSFFIIQLVKTIIKIRHKDKQGPITENFNIHCKINKIKKSKHKQ